MMNENHRCPYCDASQEHCNDEPFDQDDTWDEMCSDCGKSYRLTGWYEECYSASPATSTWYCGKEEHRGGHYFPQPEPIQLKRGRAMMNDAEARAVYSRLQTAHEQIKWLTGILRDVQSASMGECNCVDEHDTCVWCALQEWRELNPSEEGE